MTDPQPPELMDLCDQVWQSVLDEIEFAIDELPDSLSEEDVRTLERVKARAERFKLTKRKSPWTSKKYLATSGENADRWKFTSLIGSGGMADVFECEDTKLERLVAVKILLCSTSEATVQSGILAPNVIQVIDELKLPSGQFAIVMQRAEGTLADEIASSQSGIEEGQIREVMEGTAKGMNRLAKKDIVHRDLKPSNILYEGDAADRTWMVSDFGLAIHPADVDSAVDDSGVVGTPAYMSPEQATNPKAVDERSDIYSFGATFYHAWTGQPPFKWTGDFERLIREHDTGSLPAIESVRPGLAPTLADLIERCLAKYPKDRFQSFDEIVEILEGRQDSKRKQSPEFSRFVKQATELLGSGHTEHGTSETFPVPMSSTVRKLTVVTGDLTKIAEGVDAIVSADDHRLSMGGGVSEAISEWAGPFYEGIAKLTDRLTPGTSVVTPMPQRGECRYVIQGITRYKGNRDFEPTVDLVRQIINSCRPHILALGIKRIAFPLLGTGWGRLSPDDCLQTMCEQAVDLLADGSLPLNDCRIVIFNE